MNMSIVCTANRSVLVTIDGKEYQVDTIYGVPLDDSEQALENLVRMNVHFWMGRQGLDDDAPNGDYWSSHCPYEKELYTPEQAREINRREMWEQAS